MDIVRSEHVKKCLLACYIRAGISKLPSDNELQIRVAIYLKDCSHVPFSDLAECFQKAELGFRQAIPTPKEVNKYYSLLKAKARATFVTANKCDICDGFGLVPFYIPVYDKHTGEQISEYKSNQACRCPKGTTFGPNVSVYGAPYPKEGYAESRLNQILENRNNHG